MKVKVKTDSDIHYFRSIAEMCRYFKLSYQNMRQWRFDNKDKGNNERKYKGMLIKFME